MLKRVKRRVGKSNKLFPESEVQVAALEWLGLSHPVARNAIIKISNEGKRSAAGHSLAARLGMYVGASDLLLAWPNLSYAGLFLEVKPMGWKATPSKMLHHQRQLDFIEHMKSLGYHGEVGVGVDECIRIFKEYLTPK